MIRTNYGTYIDPKSAACEDCETAIAEGADPAELRDSRIGADEALINAMGRAWVCRAAGAPDDSEESWEKFAVQWCERYATYYRKRADEIAQLNP